MLPLLILIVPPFLVGGSYLMWYSGQKMVLSQTKRLTPPPQSTASYSAGIASLVGTYGLLSAVFFHNADKTTPTAATEKKVYVPPKNFADVFQRVGRPVLMRAGAGSVAFLCAGAAQTYVALRNNKK